MAACVALRFGGGPCCAAFGIGGERGVEREQDGVVLRGLAELAVFRHRGGGVIDGAEVGALVRVAVVEAHDLGVDVQSCGVVGVGVDQNACCRERRELGGVGVGVVGHDDDDADARLGAVGQCGDDLGVAHLLVFDQQSVLCGVDEIDKGGFGEVGAPDEVVGCSGHDGGVGEVGVKDGFDLGYVLGIGVGKREVAGDRVVAAGEVEGEDHRGSVVDGDGLLVGGGVGGIGPVAGDSTRGERVVGGSVAGLLEVLVEDDADGNTLPGERDEFGLRGGVDELVHGHVEGLGRGIDKVIDRRDGVVGFGIGSEGLRWELDGDGGEGKQSETEWLKFHGEPRK